MVAIVLEALERSRERLLSLRGQDGCWRGALSSSALSTATAAFALSRAGAHGRLVGPALAWMRANQNEDGGWGDTVRSPSNVSTTLLAWSALSVAEGGESTVARAEAYVVRQAGSTRAGDIVAALANRYGDDRTFCVPILMMCALAGRLGGGDPWSWIPRLPFEAAALPHAALRWLRLPVVSYAMPALIAVGQAVHVHRRGGGPVRWLRSAVAGWTRGKLSRIQPESGGFLEAAPLTSFVMMALASIGQGVHSSVKAGGEFLARTVRPDGSWPIDTDLSTWVTTLSINALSAGESCGEGVPLACPAGVSPASSGGLADVLSVDERVQLLRALLSRQLRVRHPYTAADPGGWAWTDLSGGVPDADDTAGALVAMANLCASLERAEGVPPSLLCEARAAAQRGLDWLMGVQNRDGGVPTFCRGWGRLPFDRSSPDLTAHAALAMRAWAGRLAATRRRGRFTRRLGEFLERSQSPAGSWVPLWFGNELAVGGENPVYGTSRVLLGWPGPDAGVSASRHGAAVEFLLSQQNDDGGWGACRGVASSIEETAVAVEALCVQHGKLSQTKSVRPAVERGVAWLIGRTDGGRVFEPAPIGLYFASLWYYEETYPVAMTIAALTRAVKIVT